MSWRTLALGLMAFGVWAITSTGCSGGAAPTPTPTAAPTPTASAPRGTVSPALQEIASGAGYNLIWQGDPKDTTGRTVFYDWRGPYGNGGIGPREVSNPDGTTYIRHIAAVFRGFQNIPNSSDKYLLLEDPVTQGMFPPLRISQTPLELVESGLTPSEAPRFPATGTPRFPLTSLLIEDLSVMQISGTSTPSLGYLKDLSDTDLQTVLQPGDAVAAYLWSNMMRSQQGVVTGTTRKDDDGNYGVLRLYVRRFGGKTQIEKELGRPI